MSNITWNAGATKIDAQPVNSYTSNKITDPLTILPNKRSAIDKIGVNSLTIFSGNKIHNGWKIPKKCFQL